MDLKRQRQRAKLELQQCLVEVDGPIFLILLAETRQSMYAQGTLKSCLFFNRSNFKLFTIPGVLGFWGF